MEDENKRITLEEAIEKLKETRDSYLKDELDLSIERVLKELDDKNYKIKCLEEAISDLKDNISWLEIENEELKDKFGR